MANYDANINVRATVTRAMRDLRSLQSIVDGIASRTKDLTPNIPSLNAYNRQLREATRQLALAGQYSIDEGKAIKAVVEATKNQEEAQKRINNLLREANGLRAAETERKATNTYKTTQNRKSFLAEQASDVEKLQAALGGLQSSGPNPFGIGPDQRQEELLNRYTADMNELQQVLSSMEGRSYNPFGISAQQIEIADHNTKKWKADLEDVNRQLKEAGLLAEKTREVEGAASVAARQRLEQQSAARRTAATDPIARMAAGVKSRPVANYNPSNVQLGPAGNAEAVRLAAGNAMRRRSEAQVAYEGEIARIKRDFDIKNHHLQIDLLQKELAAELDNIDAVLAARKKANADAEADFDKRLAARGEAKAAATEKRKAFGRQAESLALGVGFPLLFGGGPGAVGGAAAGSFVGSGFGGQILGGAIGQALDQFAQGVGKVGSAMRAPIANFKELADANLLAGKAQATYIQKLIEAGKTAEASALIQSEITKKIGVQGMKDLQNAGAASDKLNKAMATLGLQMQAFVAGPLAGFISGMAKLVNVVNTRNSIEAQQAEIYKNLNPNDRKSFAQAVDRTKSGATLFSSDLSQREAELQRIFETYRAKLPKLSASAPGTTVESQQARATSQELQKQVELSRANLSLTGLTLEKDGARYVAAAKNVALQELDNKLLEIKNSWIGKIFDKERNLAMIRSANLDYQAKLQQINAQVAQKSLADSNSLLQQEQALFKVRSESLDALVQIQTVQMGEESGLKLKLDLFNKIRNVRLAEFDVEKELALKEAAKNGTLETTNRVLAAKRALLKIMLDIEELTTEQKKEQLRIDRQINENRKTLSFAQQMQGVFAQTPINRTPLEQLQFDQATRRGNTLNPMYQQLSELQMQLTDKTLVPGSDQANKLTADLSRVNSEIGKMNTALTIVEGKEIAWQKNRLGAEALVNVLNGVGTTVTNVFSSLVTGTDNWANSLLNVFNIFTNLLAQAGLSALAGTDGRGFFSILNGTFGRKAAKGAYFADGVAAFGMGGTFANSIVRTPTLFKYAKGGALATGVMGEAGPEAVMPLTRGPNGKLGVSGYGGGSGNVSVVVNVDASGSKVQGDDTRANELGRLVSFAVQQELIKQKRPGGVLA